MKNKFLIPVLAMIFATGLSFATAERNDEQALDYIRVNNQWMAIPEIDCGQAGENECQVELQDGTVHSIFDTQSSIQPKKTTKTEPVKL
ncbi:DUF6520 family protein [Mesonia sp. K4-1]|jgi:hypothetical protein|uniref:DUF6520 family protein n=1 Tax=Mesonia sp. K4-1 TaxID=2602760 RepID=UPI0011CB229F|nr:DUF6520 family protein [Mesonia sp. K4-1]TXK77856.1 hypothetical protein FT986_03925 [Mesonia sp. K4-1]